MSGAVMGVIGQNIVIDCGTHEDALRLVDHVTLDSTPPGALLHRPGDPHDYRVSCSVCGERGYLSIRFDPEYVPTPPDAPDVRGDVVSEDKEKKQ